MRMDAYGFIVNAATVNDVVVAVQFAANHGLKVSARGTGHQLSGIAIPANGVLVNMASLNAISADVAARTATVQLGAKSGDVARATVPSGFVPIVGTCQDVGVAGFTLQGGSGWASAYLGPASDNVLSLDAVTVGANRTAVLTTVTAQSDPELFFGLRGGAPIFSIVVAMTVRTFPVPQQMTSLSYTYPISQINNVLGWWLPWITSPPAPFGNAIELTNIPRLGNTVTVQTFVLVPNTTDVVAKLDQQAAFAASTGQLLATNNTVIPTVIFMGNNDYCEILDGDFVDVMYWNTFFTPSQVLPPGFVSTLLAQLAAPNAGSFTIYLTPSATPAGQPPSSYGFRNALQLDVSKPWKRTAGGAPADNDAANIQWVKSTSALVEPFSAGRYINQLMMEMPDDARASYEPATWARLVALKAARDPYNLFRDLNYVHTNYAAPGAPALHDVLFKQGAAFSALAPAPGRAHGALPPASAQAAASAPDARDTHIINEVKQAKTG